MMIDFDKIEHIYGESIIDSIYNIQEDIINNLEYFSKLGFTDALDIFERQAPVFICSSFEFQEKINNLIKRVGSNFVEIIQSDISILDNLL